MEIIRGKHASFMSGLELARQLNGCECIHIDIGTGDGKFVQHVAQAEPQRFVIGIDACRENLIDTSRRALTNVLFVIANAQALPGELYGLGTHLSINFPWGSLLDGLLRPESGLLEELLKCTQAGAAFEVRLNGGALAEQGWTLEAGTAQVQSSLAAKGFTIAAPYAMQPQMLKRFPTTWAKRIAFGRDPRAMVLKGIKAKDPVCDDNRIQETL